MPEGAAAAEGFCKPPLGKACAHGSGTGAGENFGQGLFVDVAQGDIRLGIETARHHGAVHQDGDMIPQPPAGPFVAQIRGWGMGPGEAGVLA